MRVTVGLGIHEATNLLRTCLASIMRCLRCLRQASHQEILQFSATLKLFRVPPRVAHAEGEIHVTADPPAHGS